MRKGGEVAHVGETSKFEIAEDCRLSQADMVGFDGGGASGRKVEPFGGPDCVWGCSDY